VECARPAEALHRITGFFVVLVGAFVIVRDQVALGVVVVVDSGLAGVQVWGWDPFSETPSSSYFTGLTPPWTEPQLCSSCVNQPIASDFAPSRNCGPTLLSSFGHRAAGGRDAV